MTQRRIFSKFYEFLRNYSYKLDTFSYPACVQETVYYSPFASVVMYFYEKRKTEKILFTEFKLKQF